MSDEENLHQQAIDCLTRAAELMDRMLIGAEPGQTNVHSLLDIGRTHLTTAAEMVQQHKLSGMVVKR